MDSTDELFHVLVSFVLFVLLAGAEKRRYRRPIEQEQEETEDVEGPIGRLLSPSHGILSLLSLSLSSHARPFSLLLSGVRRKRKREKGEDSMVDRTPRQTGSSFYQQLFSFIIS